MRPARLFLALALLPALAGCELFGDCPPADYFEDRLPPTSLRASAPVADTLTVAFVTDYRFDFRVFVRPGAEQPSDTTSGPEVSLFYEAFVGSYARSVPSFETAVRGDTLWVRPALDRGAGLARPVCSYASQQLDVSVIGTLAPSGVRHVRFAVVEDRGTSPVRAAVRLTARPFLRA